VPNEAWVWYNLLSDEILFLFVTSRCCEGWSLYELPDGIWVFRGQGGIAVCLQQLPAEYLVSLNPSLAES
jgi:hypothetical protein